MSFVNQSPQDRNPTSQGDFVDHVHNKKFLEIHPIRVLRSFSRTPRPRFPRNF